MKSNKDEISNILQSILFIVIFFIFASAFSDKSDFQTSFALPASFQYELEWVGHSSQQSALIVDCIQMSAVLKSYIGVTSDSDFYCCSEHYRILACNNKISQNIKLTRRIKLEINTQPVWVFYFHSKSADSEDFPVLS
jgi:hypothetical protein